MAGLSDLTSVDAVLKAVAEYDKLGKNAFLAKYEFREARSYYLVHNGKRYDSKAIVGAAIGYQYPDQGALAGRDFVGGQATVRPKLESLGFIVTSDESSVSLPLFTSEWLVEGAIYPRETLIEKFSITDATVNTGVFRPPASKSIWLFVTRDKTNDRTQYKDSLEGDLLHWEGQPTGRTDALIIDHEQNRDELLLFYRTSKRQHAKAGFQFEGRFRYLSHQPGNPSRFTLQRAALAAIEQEQSNEGEPHDPTDTQDGRKKVFALVARRQGQATFRRELMKAHNGTCAVTGCTIEPLLEAAHIRPYLGPETNHVTNGLLLRADIHTLFDLGLLTIDTAGCVEISQRLVGTDYATLANKPLRTVSATGSRPSPKALAWHRTSWMARHADRTDNSD